MRNIPQNLFFAFVYNPIGVPHAAGVLYPAFGLLLNPMIAAEAMSFVTSIFLGAIYVFVFAWIFAVYFVWLHNTSLIAPENIGKTDVAERSRVRAA